MTWPVSEHSERFSVSISPSTPFRASSSSTLSCKTCSKTWKQVETFMSDQFYISALNKNRFRYEIVIIVQALSSFFFFTYCAIGLCSIFPYSSAHMNFFVVLQYWIWLRSNIFIAQISIFTEQGEIMNSK